LYRYRDPSNTDIKAASVSVQGVWVSISEDSKTQYIVFDLIVYFSSHSKCLSFQAMKSSWFRSSRFRNKKGGGGGGKGGGGLGFQQDRPGLGMGSAASAYAPEDYLMTTTSEKV